MKQVGFGFIGCGEIARSTAKAVAAVEGARIAAAYESAENGRPVATGK